MLKFKFLFENFNLARMALGNWEYDEETLEEMFAYYRISSNAIYPFRDCNKVKFLRLSPVCEKIRENLIGELEFIQYLRNNGYPALEPVLSKNGRYFEEVATPWGEYYACVFERVAGVRLDQIKITQGIAETMGQSLGRLHKLSSRYEPTHCKWTHDEVFDWIYEVLDACQAKESAFQEYFLLKEQLRAVPKTPDNYGLVHYDFETDNVFYEEETSTCSIIDFDDGMYHWYALDIEQTLDSIAEDLEEDEYEKVKENFLRGYRSEFDLADNMLACLPIFRRFIDLFGYSRILRSCCEKWDHEPVWMRELREKLAVRMDSIENHFGKDL